MPHKFIAKLIAPLAVLALSACATDAKDEPAFDASACYQRQFNVYFDSWQHQLSETAQNEIATIQQALQGCSIDKVRIVGMAGAPGDEEANIRVSQERADAIAAALAAGGWPRTVFEQTAIGEAGATVGDMDVPMRRRVQVTVDASAP